LFLLQLNGSKGTITTRTSNGNTQHKLVFDPCGSVKCAGKCRLSNLRDKPQAASCSLQQMVGGNIPGGRTSYSRYIRQAKYQSKRNKYETCAMSTGTEI